MENPIRKLELRAHTRDIVSGTRYNKHTITGPGGKYEILEVDRNEKDCIGLCPSCLTCNDRNIGSAIPMMYIKVLENSRSTYSRYSAFWVKKCSKMFFNLSEPSITELSKLLNKIYLKELEMKDP